MTSEENYIIFNLRAKKIIYLVKMIIERCD